MRSGPREPLRSVDRGAHRPAIEPRKYPLPGCRHRSADGMAWCEANDVDFVFELARNERLVAAIESELDRVVAKSRRTGRALLQELHVDAHDLEPQAPGRGQGGGHAGRMDEKIA